MPKIKNRLSTTRRVMSRFRRRRAIWPTAGIAVGAAMLFATTAPASAAAIPAHVSGHYVIAPGDVAPTAAFPLNDNTTDATGNGHTLNWVGTPAYGAGLVSGTQAAEASNGTNFLQLPETADTTPATTGSFSIEFWLNEASTTSDSAVLSDANFNACNNPGFNIYNQSGTGLPRFCVGDTSGGNKDYDMFSSSEVLPGGGWHYFTLTYSGTASSGGTFTGYFDGQKAFTQTVQAGANLTGLGTISIGYDQDDDGDGYIDGSYEDFDYYNSAISATQVANDYEATMPPPSAPAGVTAAATSGTTATVSWNAGSAAGYDVYDATTTGGENTSGTPACTAAAGATSCSVTGLTPGTKYYFKVVATSPAGSSPASAEVSATPLATPSGLTAKATNGAIKLSWRAYSGATGYKVYAALSSDGESTNDTPACTTTSATSCTVSGLTDGVPFYFVLVANTNTGASPMSAEASATAVGIPAGVHVTLSGTTAKISWDTAFGATKYAVYDSLKSGNVSAAGRAVCTKVSAAIDSTESCTVRGLVRGKRYYFAVGASNNTGSSPLSAQKSILVPKPKATKKTTKKKTVTKKTKK